MEICILTPELLPNWGGAGTYCIELTKALSDKHDIHLVTLEREENGRPIYSKKEMIDYFDGRVDIHILTRAPAEDTFLYNGKFQMTIFRKLPMLVKEHGIELVHSHFPSMPDILLRFRNLKVPAVTTVHTMIESHRMATRESSLNLNSFESSEKYTLLMYPFLKVSEEIYFSKKRHYVVPSDWMKKLLQTRVANSIINVIPNSVDLSQFDEKTEPVLDDDVKKSIENKRVILFVGRLLAMKGINTFIESIPSVIKAHGKPDLLFLFVGPGTYSHYEAILRKIGVSPDSYMFSGQLPRECVVSLMRDADFLVQPSFIENCPYTVIESMACGTPVVASRVGGVPEIIDSGHNGVLVEPGLSSKLSEAMSTLLDDEEMRLELGKHARETIERRFSWRANRDRYEQLYENVLKAGT